jgi:hypothetical protein
MEFDVIMISLQINEEAEKTKGLANACLQGKWMTDRLSMFFLLLYMHVYMCINVHLFTCA